MDVEEIRAAIDEYLVGKTVIESLDVVMTEHDLVLRQLRDLLTPARLACLGAACSDPEVESSMRYVIGAIRTGHDVTDEAYWSIVRKKGKVVFGKVRDLIAEDYLRVSRLGDSARARALRAKDVNLGPHIKILISTAGPKDPMMAFARSKLGESVLARLHRARDLMAALEQDENDEASFREAESIYREVGNVLSPYARPGMMEALAVMVS